MKFLHRHRGHEATDAINIIPRYGGILIHDCLAMYFSYLHCGHAVCGAHLLRELTFVIDSHGYPWARNMKRLLQQTCALVAKRPDKKLTEREYQNLQ